MASGLYSILEQAREEDKAGNYSAALMKYRLFLKHEKGDPQAWADYAGLLLVLDRHEDCIQACSQALEIDPGFTPALLNKAGALTGLSRLEEARAIYEYLHTLDRPEFILALHKFLQITEDTIYSESELLRILDADPNNMDALIMLASHYKKNDYQKYMLYIKTLIDLQFTGDKKLWEKAVILLRLGEYKEGFKLAENRPSNILFPAYAEPKWTGKPFPGHTLLLYWEQGFGDTIMMLRYGPLVKALGGNVVLIVQNALVDIAKTCDGFDYVVTDQGPRPKFDFWLPLMSLPLVLGTELNTIPARIPYLKIPPFVKNKNAITDRLNLSNIQKRIGLVWAGNKIYENDALRSISPSLLTPFEQYKNAVWYSLQREAPDLIPFNGIVPLGDLMDSFSDTAYAVFNMDLIVTVDTAIAHLAGALGKPVMLMLPFASDWRWMLERSDSPWYPTVRIYRQSFKKNWTEVINAVLNDCDEVLIPIPDIMRN